MVIITLCVLFRMGLFTLGVALYTRKSERKQRRLITTSLDWFNPCKVSKSHTSIAEISILWLWTHRVSFTPGVEVEQLTIKASAVTGTVKTRKLLFKSRV